MRRKVEIREEEFREVMEGQIKEGLCLGCERKRIQWWLHTKFGTNCKQDLSHGRGEVTQGVARRGGEEPRTQWLNLMGTFCHVSW